MTTLTLQTVRAARNRASWGAYATRQYCINRGIDLRLYRLACQLQAVTL